MTGIYVAWGASALVIVALAIGLSFLMKPPHPLLGILIDNRGRYSLTHFQLVVWSIVILSLISGVFWGRLAEGVSDPLSFKIPSEVLGLLGITVGSAVTATAVKAAKNITRASFIAASGPIDPPHFSQIFMLEEGEFADKVIDVTKFQNFIITVVLVAAYVGLAINAVEKAGNAGAFGSLPGFSGTFLVLVGISHAAYLAGKLPNQKGTPAGLTVSMSPGAHTTLPAGFRPRNQRPPRSAGLEPGIVVPASSPFDVALSERNVPGRRLGRHVLHDERSRQYPAALAPLTSVRHAAVGLPLNQGEIGSCTANALCGALDSEPDNEGQPALIEEDAVKLYELETQLEGKPYPENDPGGTGLMVCKAAQQRGLITSYQHAFGLQQALEALVVRPVITGIPWYTSFDTPDPETGMVTIAPDATIRGGHEIVADEIDAPNELVWFWNSWGPMWGKEGRFCMKFATWDLLLKQRGDVTVPVR
jgi:hypothetical protein